MSNHPAVYLLFDRGEVPSGWAFGAGVSFSGTYYGATPGTQGGVVSADLNRDGLPTIVVANTQGTYAISVFLATSRGTFNAEKDYPVSTAFPDFPIVADLNGDGALDLIFGYWFTPPAVHTLE